MGNSFGSVNQLEHYDPNNYINDIHLDLNPENYPNFGNYTFERMPLNDLIALLLEEQMRFSDAICRKYALNDIFKNQQLQFWETSKYNVRDNDLDETSIGNVAFMKFYNPENPQITRMYDETVAIVQNGRLPTN